MKIYSDGNNRVLKGNFPKRFKLLQDGNDIPFLRTGAGSIRIVGEVPVGYLDIEEIEREARRPTVFQDSRIVMVSDAGIARLEQLGYDLDDKSKVIDEKANRIEKLGKEVSEIEKGNAEAIKQMGVAVSGIVDGLRKDISINAIQTRDIKSVLDNAVPQKIQSVANSLASHETANNPHKITKATIGLDKVENIRPSDLPVSKATKKALDEKADKSEVENVAKKIEEVGKKNEELVRGFDNMNLYGGIGSGESIAGGKKDQVLTKNSSQNGDYSWRYMTGSLNVDGGHADTIYTSEQLVNGGKA